MIQLESKRLLKLTVLFYDNLALRLCLAHNSIFIILIFINTLIVIIILYYNII